MHSAPVSLFEKIPDLTQIIGNGQNICLIFNLECIDNSRCLRSGQNLNGIQRHIHWIADLPNITPAILSNGQLSELEAVFDNHNIIMAPNSGYEIYTANLSWVLPDLNLIRQELTDIFSSVQESMGFALQPEHLSFSQSELWLKVSAGAEAVRNEVIAQFKARNPTRLRLSVHNDQVMISPRTKWDRGKAVLKILDMARRPDYQLPVPIYFGVEEDDESAFQAVNKIGFSVIIHNRIPRTTEARYFLRDAAELSKFLFWIHSR